jgi:hypothetical protein
MTPLGKEFTTESIGRQTILSRTMAAAPRFSGLFRFFVAFAGQPRYRRALRAGLPAGSRAEALNHSGVFDRLL